MKHTEHYILPSVRYKQKVTVFSILSVVVVGTSIYLDFNPLQLFTEFHYVTDLIKSMLPPHFGLVWSSRTIPFAILETICMAFLGSIAGGLLAIGIAFLAANNTMPFRAVRVIARIVLAAARVIPPLIMILIFVVAIGLGAFAGMLTLVIGTIGSFGQLFTDIIENTESAPSEAIYSVGAARWQVIRYVIFPQVLPSFIANLFYSYDYNLRAAIGLGIFGGGGIGFQLFLAMRVLQYRDALALVCLTVVLIVAMEKISDWLRERIFGDGLLR